MKWYGPRCNKAFRQFGHGPTADASGRKPPLTAGAGGGGWGCTRCTRRAALKRTMFVHHPRTPLKTSRMQAARFAYFRPHAQIRSKAANRPPACLARYAHSVAGVYRRTPGAWPAQEASFWSAVLRRGLAGFIPWLACTALDHTGPVADCHHGQGHWRPGRASLGSPPTDPHEQGAPRRGMRPTTNRRPNEGG